MNRRALLIALGAVLAIALGAVLAAPRAIEAQQSTKTSRIGIVLGLVNGGGASRQSGGPSF
jgi:hypothetical protein